MFGIYRTAGVGAFVSVKDEAALMSLDVSPLTLGTFAYVTTEGLYFQLVTDGSNDLIWQQVVFGGPAIFDVVESDEIDLLTPGAYTIVPANSSKRFIPTGFIVGHLTQVAGTATAAGNVTLGTNATRDNCLSTVAGTGLLTTAWLNGGVGNLKYTNLAVAGNIPTVVAPNSALTLVITQAPAGVTAAKVKYLIAGYVVS